MVDFTKLFEADEEAALKNYAASLPVTEVVVDPQTGFEYKREIVPALKLPVQGMHDYVAGSGDVRPPLEWFPSIQQGIENSKAIAAQGFDSPTNIKNKLFGGEGVERSQMWPEKMVRSGVSLAGDVMSGAVTTGVGLRKGDYSDNPYAQQPLSHLIERTQDMAGLAAGGSIAATGLKAEAPGVISRGAKALKDRLQEVFAEDAKAGTAIGAIKNVANRETMPEILNRQRASEGYEAAIRDPETKKLYTGMWHEEVLDKMANDKGISKDELPTNIVKGYIDNNGRFLTEAQLEKRSQSKSAMFRSDDEAVTALAALNNTLGTDKFGSAFESLKNLSKEDLLKISNQFVSKTPESMSKNKILERIQERHDKLVKFQGELNRGVGSRSAFSDDIVGTGIAAAANAPRFYSHVENVINNATMMVRNAEGKRVEVPQQKFNSNELLAYLKNKGATAEEIEALKLPEFLEGKKNVTKEELNKYINENKVELEETVLGHQSRAVEIGQEWPALGAHNQPRFAQYQLPGGENYRETLLSLKANPQKVKRIEEINNEIAEIQKKQKMSTNQEYDELQNRKYDLAAERLELDQSFSTDHWPNNKDIVVHSRTNDRFIPDENGPSNQFVKSGKSSQDLIKDWGYTNQQWKNLSQEQRNEIISKNNNALGSDKKGLNSLHAEEIQSDWLQKGNSEGFKLSAKDKTKLEPQFNKIDEKILATNDESILANPDLKDAIKTAIDKKIITKAEGDLYLRYSAGENYGAVPDAPFKSSWSDLMIKRLIRQAAEEGKDSISWTPGQAQIDRYPGLQKHFDKVEYNPKSQEFIAYGKDGNITRKTLSKSELVDYIGKEATEKLLNNPSRKSEGINTLDNADLKVGGEFHKKFYDEILVNKVNAIAKKFGGRVEEKNLSYGGNKYGNKYGWEKGDDGKFYITTPDGRLGPSFATRQEAQHEMRSLMQNYKEQPVWVLRLTPEMKKHALEKGFSMFETGLPLVPVQGNPFEDNKKKFKLIPIQGNPFQ